MYIQTSLLHSCVKEESEVLSEFIENCGDKILDIGFVFKSAKGGNFAKEKREQGFNVERYEYDQNMFSHIFNGLFPTHDLLKVLEEKDVLSLSNLDKKIYTLAYLAHDIDKVWGKEVKTDSVENINIFKEELLKFYLSIKANEFLPELETYIGDLAFLVVNTQKSRGANLDGFNFKTNLKDRSLNYIKKLCTYSDKIAYLIKTPSDVISGDGNINSDLEDVSDRNLKMFFHKVPEVRGLITNIINNAITDIYKENGFIPYLIFSDGVVYLAEREKNELVINNDEIFEKVKKSLSKLCGEKIKKDKPGFKFTNLSTTKNPQYYFDFISFEEYFHLVKEKAIDPSGADPSVKMVEHFKKLKHDNYQKFTYKPDEKIGGLGRFLIFVEDYIVSCIDNKDVAIKLIFNTLELKDYYTDFLELKDAITNTGGYGKVSGGVKIEWFYLASKFLEKHRGITFDSYDNDFSIKFYLEKLIDKFIEEYSEVFSENIQFKGVYLNVLKDYISDLNIDKIVNIFQSELVRYTESKKIKKNNPVCTICSSSYPVDVQEDNSLPFQGGTFKNKLLTFKGGDSCICSICSMEFMLRQILIKGTKLSGKDFEKIKPKYIYVYPNYFFTTSTHKFVRKVLENSKNLNIFHIKSNFSKDLASGNFSYKTFFNSEEHILPIDPNAKDTSYLKMDFPEKENMNLIMTCLKGGESDTESWTTPTLLSFFYFIMLNAKVVVSDSVIPLYNSQHELKESIVLDSVHSSIKNILSSTHLNIDEIYPNFEKLMACYSIHIDTYSDGGKPNWNQFNEISRGLSTDLLEVFKFMEVKQRKDKRDGTTHTEANLYLKYLDILGGAKEMSLIKQTVDLYAKFYSAEGYSSYGIRRPVTLLTDFLLKTDPQTLTMEEDTKLMLVGELMRWTSSVIGKTAKGFALLRGKELNDSLNDFVNFFYDEIFKKYCQSDVSLLRNRLNGFLGGCEAYYVANYKNYKNNNEEEQKDA
jgi:CRISPR-associated protein Csc3